MKFITALYSIGISSILVPSAMAVETNMECLQRLIVGAEAETTVGELQAQCEQLANQTNDVVDTVAEERKAAERAVATNRFTLLQHYPNYALPISYNFNSDRISAESVPGNPEELDATEFKFQISFKSL